MNRLINEDYETSTSIKRREWKQVKDSETEGNHSSEDNDTA